MTAVNVYQQRPTTGAKAESSLHHADLASLVGKGRKNAGVTVREKKLLGHLTLRGDGHDPAFAAGVHKALGLELPGALTVVIKGETSLQWLGPDEWLLVVPTGEEFAAEQKLREALGDLHIQIVNVSGGQQILELSGERARRADEIHQLRCSPKQLSGGQGGGHGVRQVATGNPPHCRRHLGTGDPPQLLRLLVAVAAGCGGGVWVERASLILGLGMLLWRGSKLPRHGVLCRFVKFEQESPQ